MSWEWGCRMIFFHHQLTFLSFLWSPQVFSNLDEMISHHKHNQLLLIDSKSQAKHRAYLTHPAHP